MSATGIVGGAAVPHAPQFLTMPDTEDHEQVRRVKEVMGRIGDGLRALQPDVVLICANDHVENFMLQCVPSFTLHCGAEVSGSFAGHEFRWPVASGVADALLRDVQDQGFDPAFSLNAGIGYEFGIPLNFLGFDAETPLVPLYVNTYVAPQPRSERCYAFGQAVTRAFRAMGVRAVMISSGGMSHYPGTERYADPDVSTDKVLMEQLRAGNLRALIALDDAELDRTGNVELRSWQILAGALGERRPDETSFEPSWHHTYATLGWTTEPTPRTAELHYPPIHPDRVPLSEALYGLRMESEKRRAFLADADAYANDYNLEADERAALVDLDEEALVALDIHPLLAFLARLQVDLERKRT